MEIGIGGNAAAAALALDKLEPYVQCNHARVTVLAILTPPRIKTSGDMGNWQAEVIRSFQKECPALQRACEALWNTQLSYEETVPIDWLNALAKNSLRGSKVRVESCRAYFAALLKEKSSPIGRAEKLTALLGFAEPDSLRLRACEAILAIAVNGGEKPWGSMRGHAHNAAELKRELEKKESLRGPAFIALLGQTLERSGVAAGI